MSLPDDRIFCCRCKAVAVGRTVFLNRRNEVVDNPFCKVHWEEITLVTLASLKRMYNDPSYDIMGLQVWKVHESPSKLPEGEQGLLELVADEAEPMLVNQDA